MSELLHNTIEKIKPLNKKAMAAAQVRQDTLTKPPGSLGRLEELSIQLAGIQKRTIPQIRDKAIIIMAGDHGVAAEGIGNWPQEVTAQMVYNFLCGGAGINVLAHQAGIRLVVVDMGVVTTLEASPRLLSRKIASGTSNIAMGKAMTIDQMVQAIETGIEIIDAETAKGLDVVGTGDMGIGNTTVSSAICAVMMEKAVAEVTGRGTGIDDEQLDHKIAVIQRALEVNQPERKKPLEVLAKIGGFEIAGLVGVILAAAANRIPIVIDGFISGAAVLIASALSPKLKDYLIAGHVSAEAGHAVLLEYLGLKPVLNLSMRLGEGTGAALCISLVEAAARIMKEMSTFAKAGVSERSKN